MTLERGLRPTSPVHVCVDDSTPVHLTIMKRAKKPKSAAASVGSANRRPRSSRRAVPTISKSRARSCSPGAGGPWVPAPGKSTRGNRITWQSPTRKVGIPAPDHGELSTEEEDAVHGTMRQYEDKIDTLMSHVGTLKSEVDLQRALHELDAKDQMLDTSHRTLEKQEATLRTIETELQDREQENYMLRKSVDITKFTYTTGPPLSEEELEQLGMDYNHFDPEGVQREGAQLQPPKVMGSEVTVMAQQPLVMGSELSVMTPQPLAVTM